MPAPALALLCQRGASLELMPDEGLINAKLSPRPNGAPRFRAPSPLRGPRSQPQNHKKVSRSTRSFPVWQRHQPLSVNLVRLQIDGQEYGFHDEPVFVHFARNFLVDYPEAEVEEESDDLFARLYLRTLSCRSTTSSASQTLSSASRNGSTRWIRTSARPTAPKCSGC